MYSPLIASDSNEPSLSSLPRDILWDCLLRVPWGHLLNVSRVSKTLRSLVLSPEFRSLLPKDSLYLSFLVPDKITSCKLFTLRGLRIENTNKIEYQLVPVAITIPILYPYDSCRFCSSPASVAVGPEIYFLGGSCSYCLNRSKDLWIFDTRSGKFTQGPSMKVARRGGCLVGVVHGKIYVIGGKDDEKKQVEVFDPKSRSWSFTGEEEKVRCISRRFAVSMDQKVYIVGYNACISVYNPNLSEGRRVVEEMTNLKKRTREDMLGFANSDYGVVGCVCVVENVIYACFSRGGLKWFDTKLNVWKKVVTGNGKPVCSFYVSAMAEYNGMLAVFWLQIKFGFKKDVKCGLISLFKNGERIRGKIEWSGIVATIPSDYRSMRCLVVSDQ